jgi:hypothetical protein
MLLGDTVPRFRRDLKIQRKSESGGLYEVSDPVADKHFTLYDIELSIARMLDGHRTVQEVIEAGTKIGIPITLESLEKFEKQLTAYGFLQAGTVAGNGDAWAPRDEWPPEVREMFRSALLKYRQSRFDEATDYLKAMLAIDSNNKDAQEVLKSIEVKKKEAKPAAEAAPIFAPVLEASGTFDASKKPAPDTKAVLSEPAGSPAPAPAAASPVRASSPAVKSLFGDLSPTAPKPEPAAPAASSIPRKSSPGVKSPLTDPAPSPAAEPAAPAAATGPSAVARKSSPGSKSPLTDPAPAPAAEPAAAVAVAAPAALPRKSSHGTSGAVALGRMTPPAAPAVTPAAAPAPEAPPAPQAPPAPAAPAVGAVLHAPAAAAPAPSFSSLVSGSTRWPPPDEPAAPAPAADGAVTDPAGNVPPATDAAPAPTEAPAAEPSVALVEQSAGPAPEPLPKWAVPATGGALALALLLMVPFPRSVPASVVLEATNAVVVKAPHDLVVKEPAVKNGTAVESGAVLLTLDSSDEPGRLRPFDTRVKELQTELEHTQRAVSKKQIASWQKTVKKIEGEIEKAKAALAKAGNEKARAAAQKKIADKERELLEANAELQDATKVDALAKLKQQLAEATAAREQAANQPAVLPSPAAGVVTDFAVAAGQRITYGAQVARIADPRELVVACSVDASEALSLAPGQKIDATLKGQSVQLLAESVAGPRVFAKIVQTQPNFIPGDTGDAKISVASKSLLGRLFR